jgi:alkylated DNA nucleotide flippase Atl1
VTPLPSNRSDNNERVRSDFVEHVLEVARSIPPGRVMTYGDVAATLGSGGARAVGTALARFGSEVAWWRVIRSGGLAPRGHEARAWAHYLAEGTPLREGSDDYRVDLTRARYRPSS